jgi:hypothetical protein
MWKAKEYHFSNPGTFSVFSDSFLPILQYAAEKFFLPETPGL